VTTAIGLLVEQAFTRSELNRLFAIPFPHNVASARALERNGFVLEARLKETLIKHGRLMDELIYGLRRADWEARNPEKAKART
jgi:RimJ/RimL family protein N-acetyltransferase